MSKVLERVVHLQLSKYLKEHQLLSPYQCGFRKFHSTETAGVSFTDTIRMNIDQGMLSGAVFIDHRKAFDSVDHMLLLSKLHSCGVANTELQWFKNYFIKCPF